MQEPSRQVLEAARLKDERAFEAVVDACGGYVLNLAWRMVRDRAEAEDMAQEVFLRLYRVFHRYDPERPFLPWLKRVATNLLINLTSGKARRKRRQSASLEVMREEAGDAVPDPRAPDAAEAAMRSERAGLLRAAIRRLRPEYAAILALRYFQGKSYEDLARDLGLPLGTVKNRLFRAREELALLVGEIG